MEMASLFGVDTSGHASEPLKTQAAPWIGGSPQFWGRYFNGVGPDDENYAYQYNRSESAVLHQLGIPVLCYARQMWAVDDDDSAADHATSNMQGVVDAFGAEYLLDRKIQPLLFLDVEPENDPDHPHPAMTKEYYENWPAAIVAGLKAGAGTIRFRPAVYLNFGDGRQTWLNLNAACAGGSVCAGVAAAHYVPPKTDQNPHPLPLPFGSMVWDDKQVTPQPNPIPPGQQNAHIPALLWQYYGDYLGDIDFIMVNPAFSDLVLSGVVSPPPPCDARNPVNVIESPLNTRISLPD
jgi:hypothetical protein